MNCCWDRHNMDWNRIEQFQWNLVLMVLYILGNTPAGFLVVFPFVWSAETSTIWIAIPGERISVWDHHRLARSIKVQWSMKVCEV